MLHLLLRGPGALLLSFACFLASPVVGGIVNRTIDDSFGDSASSRKVVYAPVINNRPVWQNDDACRTCAIRVDSSKAFKETYTAATYAPSLGSINITFSFEGFAIYVYFILANNAGDGITSLTLANFTLDNGNPFLFQHAPDLTTTDIQYNQLVYSKTNLVNANHTLVISTSVNTNVWVNFDYAIYTHDDDAPLNQRVGASPNSSASQASSSIQASKSTTGRSSRTSLQSASKSADISLSNGSTVSKPSTSKASIIGGVLGGISMLIFLIFGAIFILRRRRRNVAKKENPHWVDEPTQDPIVTPFYMPAVTPNLVSGPSTTYGSPSLSYVSRDDAASSRWRFPTSNRPETHTPTDPIPFSDISSSAAAPLLTIPTEKNSSATKNQYQPSGLKGDRTDIQQERQRALDERLRDAQQEMMILQADMTGEKHIPRRRTVRRAGENGDQDRAEAEMTWDEMRGQLQQLRNQIAYLQDQQQSSWATGLSDDPPPGYELATLTSTPTNQSEQVDPTRNADS